MKVQRSVGSREKLNCPLVLDSSSRDQTNHSGGKMDLFNVDAEEFSAVELPCEAAFTLLCSGTFLKVREIFQSSRRPPSSPPALIHGSKHKLVRIRGMTFKCKFSSAAVGTRKVDKRRGINEQRRVQTSH